MLFEFCCTTAEEGCFANASWSQKVFLIVWLSLHFQNLIINTPSAVITNLNGPNCIYDKPASHILITNTTYKWFIEMSKLPTINKPIVHIKAPDWCSLLIMAKKMILLNPTSWAAWLICFFLPSFHLQQKHNGFCEQHCKWGIT